MRTAGTSARGRSQTQTRVQTRIHTRTQTRPQEQCCQLSVCALEPRPLYMRIQQGAHPSSELLLRCSKHPLPTSASVCVLACVLARGAARRRQMVQLRLDLPTAAQTWPFVRLDVVHIRNEVAQLLTLVHSFTLNGHHKCTSGGMG